MPKAYVVTDGFYSDYRIVAVFSDEQAANTHAADHGGEVETYELYDTPPQKFIRWRRVTRVSATTGEVVADIQDHETEYEYKIPRIDFRPEVRQTGPYDSAGVSIYQIVSQGLDRAHVDKAHQDRLAKLRAELLTEPSAR